MQVAKAYRIPHSEFLGWLPDDQDKALAYEYHLAAEEAAVCPGCGTRHEDWHDPDTDRLLMNPVWEPHTYECEGCKRLAATTLETAPPDDDRVAHAAHKVALRPVDRVHPLAGIPGAGP